MEGCVCLRDLRTVFEAMAFESKNFSRHVSAYFEADISGANFNSMSHFYTQDVSVHISKKVAHNAQLLVTHSCTPGHVRRSSNPSV